MPKNNVSAVPHGPDGVELHLPDLSSSNTDRLARRYLPTYLTFLTDKLRAKPFRVKFGGQNIIGFYATALEVATVLP